MFHYKLGTLTLEPIQHPIVINSPSLPDENISLF